MHTCHALHEKYGDIVRIAPDTLSTIEPEAWRGEQDSKYHHPEIHTDSLYQRSMAMAANSLWLNALSSTGQVVTWV